MRRNGSGDSAPSRSQSSRTSRVLPTPASADDRDHVRPALLDRPRVGREQQVELAVSADEGALQTTDAARPHQRQRAQKRDRHDAAVLSLRLDAARLVELERAAHERRRALTDQDLVRRRCLLEPCRDVDGVAADERAALARPPDDDVAGVDAGAQRELAVEERLRGDGASQARSGVRARRGPRGPQARRTPPSLHRRRTSPPSRRRARSRLPSRRRSDRAVARVRSGSCAPASAVEPTRSAKRTVASFRSSVGGATSVGAPHAGQNRAASGNVAPHWAQAAMRGF